MAGASDNGEAGNSKPETRSSERIGQFWKGVSRLGKILLTVVVVLALLLIIFMILYAVSAHNASDLCLTPACVTLASSVLNSLDQSVDPCTDFYQYACGGWIKSNSVPEGETEYSALYSVSEKNRKLLKQILEDESFELKSEAEQKAHTFYKTCMNESQIEHLGAEPFLDILKKIGGWSISGDFHINRWNFQTFLEKIKNDYDIDGLFTWYLGENRQNPSGYSIHVYMSGLVLASARMYINQTKDDEFFTAYLTYMTNFGILLGGEEDATREQMEDVLEFEIQLAKISVQSEQDIDEEYYKDKSLKELAPFIDWDHFFNSAFKKAGRKFSSRIPITVEHPKYMYKMSELVSRYLSTTKGRVILNNYLVWCLAHDMSSDLPKMFQEAATEVKKLVMGDYYEEPKRYQTCLYRTDTAVGHALGAMYVRAAFQDDSKRAGEEMIRGIRNAFEENFNKLPWMDPETRKLAKEKADAISDKIGYPDFILDPEKLDEYYEDLEVDEGQYLMNNVRHRQYRRSQNIRKLDKPQDPGEWRMSPGQAYAYYDGNKNHIVVPVGIFQPPFYHPHYPKYVNYAGLGFVMGHELTHAFDDRGRQYDKHGNPQQWWKNSTVKNYHKRAQCVIDQYNSYKVNSESINGNKTLDDNIADIGGLKTAYLAYRNYIKGHSSDKSLPGISLTTNQLFFVAFAQGLCSVSTPGHEIQEIMRGHHSPKKYRAIGSISNSIDFAREFKCPSNSPMNPAKKCEVW